jgi:hypothetical protein
MRGVSASQPRRLTGFCPGNHELAIVTLTIGGTFSLQETYMRLPGLYNRLTSRLDKELRLSTSDRTG